MLHVKRVEEIVGGLAFVTDYYIGNQGFIYRVERCEDWEAKLEIVPFVGY